LKPVLRLPLFIVAPEIVDLFGGEGATRTLLAELFCTYQCVVCGNPGRLDTDHPACVAVTIHDAGTGPLGIDLAHLGCSSSGVFIVRHPPAGTGDMTVPALAWLREGVPASVVVIAPRVPARQVTGSGDLLDVLLSGLLAAGFELLAAPDTPLPVLSGYLHVRFGPAHRIRVVDQAGNAFYDATLPVPDGWAELVQVTGLIGLVLVAGIDLADNQRDHLADLYAAIRDGSAVGAAITVDPEQHPDPHPQHPDPQRPAGLPPGPGGRSLPEGRTR
jgi:hypothetical protein